MDNEISKNLENHNYRFGNSKMVEFICQENYEKQNRISNFYQGPINPEEDIEKMPQDHKFRFGNRSMVEYISSKD